MGAGANLILGLPVLIDGFVLNSQYVPYQHLATLQDAARTINALRFFNPEGIVFLWGETDLSGTVAYNNRLGQQRSASARSGLCDSEHHNHAPAAFRPHPEPLPECNGHLHGRRDHYRRLARIVSGRVAPDVVSEYGDFGHDVRRLGCARSRFGQSLFAHPAGRQPRSADSAEPDTGHATAPGWSAEHHYLQSASDSFLICAV